MEENQRINKDPFSYSENEARNLAKQFFNYLNPNGKPYLDEVEVLELLKLAYKGTSFENSITIEDLAGYLNFYGLESDQGRISYTEFENIICQILMGTRPIIQRESKQTNNERIRDDLKRHLSELVGKEIVDNELSSAVKLFNKYDKNRSGYLEEYEIPQILIDTYDAMGISYIPTEQDVRNYIDMMDFDQDGRISRYEYEIFLLRALEARGLKADQI